jgi:hypothetical protein
LTSFRDVEDDRDAGAVELVAQLGRAAIRHELAGDGLELERDSIHVELLRWALKTSFAGREGRPSQGWT